MLHIHAHIHTHKHTHTHHSVVSVWPSAHQGQASMYGQCGLPVREIRLDIQSEQVRPSYVWQCVRLLNSSWFIGRGGKEGRNSYGSWW